MARPKKSLKVKEPIRIRERKLADGNISLYLDIYVKGTRKYESLGLYLIPESLPNAKAVNARTRSIAEKIKSDRIIALQDRGIKQWEKIKRSNMSLLEQEGLSYIGMNEIDQDFCRGFLRFLETAKNSVAKNQKDRTISKGCAHHHQAVLNGALNKAVREGILQQNPMKMLDKREKFQPSPEEREFLTIEELRNLMDVPCSNEQVKKAFIFSCFAGLRLSDVRTLTWNKIHKMPDGKTLYVHVFMQKTQKPLNVPLSGEALKVLEEKENPDEPIFKLPTSVATINYHIKKWVKNGHIDKTISFHCSRHTFATMMLTLGADLYTTSKLLGHANVTTTQVYSKIIDKKKVETVNLVDNLFASDVEEPVNQEGNED